MDDIVTGIPVKKIDLNEENMECSSETGSPGADKGLYSFVEISDLLAGT